jgi:urease accessory protein UreH
LSRSISLASSEAAGRPLTTVYTPVDRRPAAFVGRHAHLDLAFERRAGRTRITRAYAEPPLRIGPSFDVDGAAYLILVCAGPGLFGGDHFQYRVSVGPGARVVLASQSAVQIHPGSAPAVATVNADYFVNESGELLCHWDPAIPFGGASLEQRIVLRLTGGSRLYWGDGFMSGRASHGEAWRFDRVDHELRLEVDGHLGYLERFRLEPAVQQVRNPWMGGPADYFGTTLVRHQGVSLAWIEDAQDRLASAGLAAVDLVDPSLGLMAARFMSEAGPVWHLARTKLRDAVLESFFGGAKGLFRR